MESITISAEKLRHNGAWRISAIIGGYLKTLVFYGYTKRQAIAEFKRTIKGE